MDSCPTPINSPEFITQLREIGLKAGHEILKVYHASEGIAVSNKADDSPVTQADLAAHHVIVDGLRALTPDIPVLSEEDEIPSFAERQSWPMYWLIDPLDGTKEFINRNNEFTVNIALIVGSEALLGLVYTPALDLGYFGSRWEGKTQAFKYQGDVSTPIQCRPQSQDEPLIVVGSRRHGAEEIDRLLERLEGHFASCELQSMGSSLKLCLIAEGKAQLYPRLAPTCEWDTAAAQAVVEAAGGQVLNPDFETLSYNQKDSLLNPYFYVLGDPSLDWPSLLRDEP